jgi:small subunit ribosomal protein S8
MLNDPLANVLSNIQNAQKTGKKECKAFPVSILITKTLEIMQHHRYIGACELVSEKMRPYLKITLLGTLNKCAVIKPRFSVQKEEYEKFEKRYLPAKDVGIMVVSTSQGLMTHHEAKKKGLGGRLIAYFY